MVLAHARALLASAPGGECAYLDADLRDAATILDGAARTLDLAQPVAVILSAVLHFIGDDEDPDPWQIVTGLLDGISAEAYLAISNGASDLAAAIAAGTREYNRRSPVIFTARTQAQVAAFFARTELLDPGVARWPSGLAWRLARTTPPQAGIRTSAWGASLRGQALPAVLPGR